MMNNNEKLIDELIDDLFEELSEESQLAADASCGGICKMCYTRKPVW
ncbi:MAG: hypothetical protein GX275_01440 [Clostridiales bacterium]|nr:hypothetical protein [Clostridiales bacterium]